MPASTATAGQVLASVRTHLNDDDASTWPDQRLFPKLQEAHREMLLRLALAGMPVINAQNGGVITVTTGTTDLSSCSGYPTNLIEPIWLKERAVGQQDQDYIDMRQVDFIPDIQQTTELGYWSWTGNSIYLLGAINDREVQLRYRSGLNIPQTNNDTIGVILGELYLSYRTAALAIDSVPEGMIYKTKASKSQMWTATAEKFLDQIVRAATKTAQALPANRRAYHRGRGRNKTLRDF